MATVVMDRKFAELLRQERAAAGSDRWDEVWEGTYMMAPLPNIEHQHLASRLTAICEDVVGWTGSAIVMQGTNVSDREAGWKHNYRCPDVAVYLPETNAKHCGTHWCGGPDFAVEIVSDDDRSRDKIPFYAQVGTRELLIVDRDPWRLELLRWDGGELKSVGTSTIENGQVLHSDVLPLSFRLASGEKRPTIQVAHLEGDKTWHV